MRDGQRVGVVLVAAGRGARTGFEKNKVLMPLMGRSVLSRCLDALGACKWLDEIVLVAREADIPDIQYILQNEAPIARPSRVIPGGDTRMESARHGLLALDGLTDIAVIHDVARPFVTPQILEAVTDDAIRYGSGVISTPVTDTIKQIDERGESVHTPDRALLRAVQTPQAFEYQTILFAHEAAREAGAQATDDAAVYERMKGAAHLTSAPGAEDNVKLTTKADFSRAEALLTGAPRVGFGYDAHRLVEGRRLILCGVDIPFEKGLDGHSDADVAVHALMDAMLGALAMGDIGMLFPDKDDAYLNADSLALMSDVNGRVRARGYRVHSADVTIVAQRPKCAPYRQQMRENIARVLEIEIDSVSVKATTTEGMGFEGEGLGISAKAVCVLTRDWTHGGEEK